MSEEINDKIEEAGEELLSEENDTPQQTPQGKFGRLISDGSDVRKLTGMYRNWFLDYASYVILERAVPHVEDGLKPVQRRILHAMKAVDDGRYNKVANIVGQTMQYHPHGDASIKDALVQLGQKDLLIDCQGNWGNILTGDEAAAGRYIEARLSKFALEVVFNRKTTEWMRSYDGRNDEPVTLPIKFPLLLAQGTEGIAVGLASKILPHNFIELINASIAHLQGRDFVLYPDFPTGGLIDVSRYNDGLRGGTVKVRARISKIDKRTLAITEIPYSTTTESIKESIIKANEKGKIKIRKVDDNTAEKVEIIIQVAPDESSDKTIDALYAFTDCEVSIAPNACVIWDEKPHFLGVSEILRRSADHTRALLGRELEIRLGELNEAWHAASLERIFIENKLYQLIEGCKTREEAYQAVGKGLEPFAGQLRREITIEDIQRLTELKFIRISRYDSERADNEIKQIEEDITQTKYHLAHLTDYAIAYYERIRQELNAQDAVDYENVLKYKLAYCQEYWARERERIESSDSFRTFREENEDWLMPYATYCYLRDSYGTSDFTKWEGNSLYNKTRVRALCSPESEAWEEISFSYFLQYEASRQFKAASDYARSKQVVLKGDLPIGVNRTGVEAWTEPDYFNMNGQAGAPPDDFSVNGQNWFFPTYNWEAMARDGYRWWKNRFHRLEEYFDCFRVDHILGFFRIWEIPSEYVQGLCGHFNPALPFTVEEISS